MAIPKECLDRLLTDMRKRHNGRRHLRAAEEFDRRATVEDVPLLRRLMAEGNNFFRACLSSTLARLEGPSALPFLLQLLRERQTEGYEHQSLVFAVTDVVTLHRTETAPRLAEMSESPDVQGRRDAAWLWGFAAPVASIEPLFRLASDSDPGVRGRAIGSLGSYKGREDVYQALVAALVDPDESVRVDAASALGYYGDPRAIALLEALATETAPTTLRHIAEYGVKQLRNPT